MLCFKGNCFLNAPLHKSHGLMPPQQLRNISEMKGTVCQEGFVSSDFRSRFQKDRTLPASVGFALSQLLQPISFLLLQAGLLLKCYAMRALWNVSATRYSLSSGKQGNAPGHPGHLMLQSGSVQTSQTHP